MPPRPRRTRKSTAAKSPARKAKAAPRRRAPRAARGTDAPVATPATPTAPAVSREQVQAAKPAALRLLKRMKAHVVGVGITRVQGQYALKVNLREPLAPGQPVPEQVDGVQLRLAVTGPITPG